MSVDTEIPGYNRATQSYIKADFENQFSPPVVGEDCFGKYHDAEDASCRKCNYEVACSTQCGTIPSVRSTKEIKVKEEKPKVTKVQEPSRTEDTSKPVMTVKRDAFGFREGAFTNLIAKLMLEGKYTWDEIIDKVMEQKPGSKKETLSGYYRGIEKSMKEVGYTLSQDSNGIVKAGLRK